MTSQKETPGDLPERFNLATEPVSARRLVALGDAFPEVFREGLVDFDALKRSLGEWVDSGPERFGLTWPGKTECMRVVQEPSVGTLAPMPDDSVDWDTTQNVIVEGENLEVLKLLQKAYYGKVKLIYIDPPYNTGNEFIYPDNFREGLADYLRYSGQVDDEGLRLTANAETGGRYHSKWLSMMYPRLFLARNLLREDGAIFATIDDHEVHNLRALMNEIFGEENFLACVIWQKIFSPKNTARLFSEDHDYVLVYARRAELWAPELLPRTEEMEGRYTNPDNDPRGVWTSADLSARNYYGEGTYAITTPSGRKISGPPAGRYWAVSHERFSELAADGRIWWGADGNGQPRVKRFLTEVKQGKVPQTLWKYQEVGHTQEAKKELLDLVSFESSDTVFDTPKPTRLIERMLRIGTKRDSPDLVLDFFAGSGSTGDAVMRLNNEDGGSRRFILIQLPEETGDGRIPTIAALVRQRVRAAGEGLRSSEASLASIDTSPDFGFRSFRLQASNFSIWDSEPKDVDALTDQLGLAIEHIRDGSTEAAILLELMLKAGYPLTAPTTKTHFAGIEAYSVSEGSLIICLSRELTIEAFEEMAEADPAMILVLDAGFGGSDELKVNALQTVRARNQRRGGDISLRVV